MKMLYIFSFLFYIISATIFSSLYGASGDDVLTAPYVYHSVNVITGSYVESNTDLTLNGPSPLVLRRCYQSQVATNPASASGWVTTLPSLLIPNNQHHISSTTPGFQFEYDDEGRLVEAKSLFPDGSVCRHMEFFYWEEDREFFCTVYADDGTSLCYRYLIDASSHGNPSAYLLSVTKDGTLLTSYEYKKHPLTHSLLLVKREESNHRYLIAEYYDDEKSDFGQSPEALNQVKIDKALGRVKLLKAPAGRGAKPVITHRFFYGDGYTEVRDALNHKIIYRYGDIERLTAIEYYDENESLYRVENFSWEFNQALLSPLMTMRCVKNAKGRVISGRSFKYDKAGNLIKETVFGNLTGENDDESSDVYYVYNGNTLVSKREGNRLKTSYRYNSQQQLISEHQVIDDFFHIRTFYEYDDKGFVARTTIDDGIGQEYNDMTGVQQRRTTKILYSEEATSYGLPVSIEEYYSDLNEGVEKLLNCTSNEYSLKGQLVRQCSFDPFHVCIKEMTYSYDPRGYLSMECEQNGDVTTTERDENGNIVSIMTQKADGSVLCKNQKFDYSNRVVRSEETDHLGQRVVSNYHYNLVGLKVADDVEGLGKTLYSYDALGRLIEIHQPPFIDADDILITPVTSYEYDVLDRVSAMKDPNGWTTKAKYNARGKPISIIYPDGTKESFKYNLEGELVEEKSRTALVTKYTRDGLGRPTKVVVLDAANRVISKTTSVYNSFQLHTKTDGSGARSVYRYDGAGRLVELLEQNVDRSKHTAYVYDEKGLVTERQLIWADGHESELVEYDQQNKPIAVKALDVNGKFLYRLNLSREEKESNHSFAGFQIDSLGREVRYLEETDRLGNIARTVFDVLGRPSMVVRKNSFGVLISQVEYRYDSGGNKTREIHSRGNQEAPFVLAWTYGVGNRMDASFEAFGAENQRLTSYAYNSLGRLIEQVKPDGVSLYYSYDSSGRIEKAWSSDQTIYYLYQYDECGNLISIQDILTGKHSVRQYDGSRQIVQDALSNGLTISFDYDERGRRANTKLPDGTGIAYGYAGQELKVIHRVNENHDFVYTHTYLDGDGESVRASKLIGGLGVLRQFHNHEGKKNAIKTPYWSEKIEYDDYGRVVGSIINDNTGVCTSSYAYDETHQVVAENGLISTDYGYDLLGNPLTGDVDALNQLKELKGTVYSYDPNGNLIEEKSSRGIKRLTYDALNRLTSVTNNGRARTVYTYDGFNRRVSKKSLIRDKSAKKWTEQSNELYIYDGLCEIGAVDSDGQIVQLRILGTGEGAEVGAAVAVELAGRVFSPIHDSRGNVAALVDMEEGRIAESYRYTAFGTSHIYDAFGDEIDVSSVGMPWGFSSKRVDPETHWVFFGLRHYDPATRRWTTPDPLGCLDGPNRYAYVHNSPVMNRDFFGEFSAGEVWNSGLKMLRHGFDFIKDLIHVYQERVGYSYYAKNDIEEYANAIVGSLFLRLTGFYVHNPETGTLGKGEINDKVRVTMINGILNIRAEYMQMVGFFSKTHGGVNIHYVFRPSDGWAHDLLKCVLSKIGIVSSQSRLLARTWKQLIREMGGVGGGGLIIHYAHSIGGTETSNAKRLLTPAERMMIRVITLGSATLIPESDFQSVVNYVSWGDGVCYFDPIGYVRALLNDDTNIYLVGSSFGIPLIDHLLENDSYSSVVRMLGADFVSTYGSL